MRSSKETRRNCRTGHQGEIGGERSTSVPQADPVRLPGFTTGANSLRATYRSCDPAPAQIQAACPAGAEFRFSHPPTRERKRRSRPRPA